MKKNSSILLLLLTTLLLMVVALYNGFPLTESDTGAYIEKGIMSIIPQDRSPFYGWFMRYTSLWATLWLTIFAQSFILAWLLTRFIKMLAGGVLLQDIGTTFFTYALINVIVIVAFTCVAWVAGYLMPDVFAGILLLSILLYFFDRGSHTGVQVLYGLIIFAAIIIHNSHFLIAAIFSALLVLWSLIRKYGFLVRRGLVLFSLSMLSWLLMCTINYANGYDFTFSRGSHVFMVTKFAETGILNAYLDEECGKKNLKLCSYKDQIPAYSWDFLWQPESPLYKTGGWDSNKAEYNMIVHDVFTTPRYLKMYISKSIIATGRELSQVQAPDHTMYMGYGSNPWWMIDKYFADEIRIYSASKQNTGGISATSCNYLYYLFFVLSSVWILYNSRKMAPDEQIIYGCIILFLVVNAFVTSTASTVHYRFQYRVFWVLPATNTILLVRGLYSRFAGNRVPTIEQKKSVDGSK